MTTSPAITAASNAFPLVAIVDPFQNAPSPDDQRIYDRREWMTSMAPISLHDPQIHD